MTCDHCGCNPEFKIIRNTGERLCLDCLAKYYPEVARMVIEHLKSKGIKG